ncbi:hypothetical protein D9Q98_009175 [Chlorella vulgaris]|uniref:RecA family profile 1 domain-containing protein n=1 Tax=Chlorella vulgaris TaxID=3077 RepID=A0A9D4TNY9_CHLVU|nr:hypothetical protein D9Q98_009175 [Chlorella vulgaris]
MASRQLQRIGLPPLLAARLVERNVTTAAALFGRTLLDLVELLDLPYDAVRHILQEVAARITPPPRTALAMLQAAAGRPMHLRTSLVQLDAALCGGIPAGSVTEVVGPAGLGKTQLCLQLAVLGCLEREAEGGSVAFIDTEKKFSARRLAQIARERLPQQYPSEEALAGMASRVLVFCPRTSQELLHTLQTLEATIIERRVRLVLLDSVASLARADFAAGSLPERQRMLGQQASRLKYLAETFHIPVLVTNQVTTHIGGSFGGGSTGGGGHLTAALGTLWAHAVNTRLVLEMVQGTRFVRIAKSPAAPIAAFAYVVTGSGLELLDGLEAPPEMLQQGSVTHMAIANEQPYEQHDFEMC